MNGRRADLLSLAEQPGAISGLPPNFAAPTRSANGLQGRHDKAPYSTR